MALSEFAARKAKPRQKPYKLTDGGGLFLLVQPNGSKLWRHKYRFEGKEKLLSFGPYPLTTIAEARAKREAAKKLLAEGSDPSVKKRLEKIAATTASRITFGLVAEEYLANMADNDAAAATLSKNRWLLEDIASSLSSRPVKEITSAEVLDLLKRVEKSGRRETARKLRGVISSVFRLAIVTLRAENDPTIALRGALKSPKTKGRAAIIDEAELGALLCTIDTYSGWPTVKGALKFLLLTCVRPGEVRGAVRSEFDREKAVWRIPAERMKMRRPHDVPLSRQALTILEDLWPLSDGTKLIFPSVRSMRQQLSENAFNAALRRMGYTKDEVTAHGFRVTASTILNSRGFDPDVIEAVLAHQDQNSIRRAYNRASYWDQRIEMMQKW
ncbi:MAG: tyrosine-type recombinase/integrase, partial [Halocynthiibacter sp.]